MDLKERLRQCSNKCLTVEERQKCIDDWFDTPSNQLRGKTPQQVIEEGGWDEVRDIVEEMYSSREFY